MGTRIPTSLLLSILLSILSFCISQNHATAQDFLKELLSGSLIKNGKQLKADGDYASAITEFTKSIKKEPENLEPYYQLGLILEDVMHDYDKAISMYKNVITLAGGITPTGTREELKEFNTLITNTRKSIDRATLKKFESIEKPKVPVYIIVKPYKKVFKEPQKYSYGIYKTTSHTNEFRLLNLNDNWYQINVPSTGLGWIRGKDVLKIIQKEKEAIETSLAGKAAQYERFVDLYPDSRFASDAKERADNIYYELAKEEDTISGYSMYLKKYPDGKYAEEVKLKLDQLTFQDEGFLNNIDRLRAWINNNPESTFLEKAKIRIEELTFAQAKYEKNITSLERYTAEYPQGKFVTDARQTIEDLKYEQAKSKDTVDSYRKYLDEYPNGKYVEDAIRKIDERKFTTLLNSKDTELLVEHLGNETNEERIELVKNRIEELYFKKAYEADNDVEAIKMHEDYLQKYPDGLYAQEAKTRIEELSFNIAAKVNTKQAYHDFISKFPQGDHYQKAIDGIEVLEFNVAKDVDTIKSYEKFLMTHPNGKLSQAARNRIEELVFDSVKKTGTVAAYEEFIKKYPESEYREVARLRIDQLNYEYYHKKNTLRAYKKFVAKYPENRYVNEVREKISQRLPTKEPGKRKSRIPIGLIIFVFGIGLIVLFVLKRKGVVRKKVRVGKKSKGQQKDAKQVIEELFGDSE
ncbi:MAG: hypothetical protein ACE5KZ_00070 [Candidatus Scalinduaceae bacterium]